MFSRISSRLALVTIAGAALLIGPAAASAAPTWLSPDYLSAKGQDADDARVAVSPTGGVIALWTTSDGTNERIQAAVRPQGGSFGSAFNLSAAGQDASDPSVAFDAHGNAVAAWLRSDGTNDRVQAAFRPAGGSFGPAVDLSGAGQDADSPRVAVSEQGDAMVVWERFDGANQRIQTAIRPAGGSFGGAVDLSEAGQDAHLPQLALDPAGDAVAVWKRSDGIHDRIQATVRPAGGSFGLPASAQTLSRSTEDGDDPQVSVDAAGDAIVVWSGNDGTDNRIEEAMRPAGGSFANGVEISGADGQEAQIAMDAAGHAMVVWLLNDGTNYRVQAATGQTGGSFAAPVFVSDAGEDADQPQVAMDPQGDAVAVWRRNDATFPIRAAIQAPGGGFGPARDLSGQGNDTNPAVVGMDTHGDAAVVWAEYDGTNYRARAAGLDAAGPALNDLSIPASAPPGVPVSFSVSPFDVWSEFETTWTFGDGASASGASVEHTFATPGDYTVTVTSTDAVGNATSATGTVSIYVGAPAPGDGTRDGSGSGGTTTDKVPPVLSSLRIAGGKVSFRLSESATVTFRIERVRRGRAGRAVRRFTRHGAKGRNVFAFTQRRKLGPGRYRLVARATDAAGNASAAKRVAFRIAR